MRILTFFYIFNPFVKHHVKSHKLDTCNEKQKPSKMLISLSKISTFYNNLSVFYKNLILPQNIFHIWVFYNFIYNVFDHLISIWRFLDRFLIFLRILLFCNIFWVNSHILHNNTTRKINWPWYVCIKPSQIQRKNLYPKQKNPNLPLN